MSKCACCGNEIRVFDIYKDCVLNKQSFNVCNSCSNKIDKWTKGELKSSEFISTETDMGLANTLIEIEKSHPIKSALHIKILNIIAIKFSSFLNMIFNIIAIFFVS